MARVDPLFCDTDSLWRADPQCSHSDSDSESDCGLRCNPDCGLKTREWQQVLPALTNMIAAAKILRKEGI